MGNSPHIAVFPGTFDPVTNGHLDVIRRAYHLFDQLVVAVGHNPEKQPLFDLAERMDLIRSVLGDELSRVKVESYDGLTVDYARRIGAAAILRGLRNTTDLHFEMQLAITNRAVADIETVFVITGEPYALTSSSLIKQLAACGDVDNLKRFVPSLVLDKLRQRKRELGMGMVKSPLDAINEE